MRPNSVLIIGAGPAGSVAATLLARRGWDVTLVEQSRFPRDKVCGECLSALGIDVLNRHQLTSPLRAFRPTLLTRAALHATDGSFASFDLPNPMWGLSRKVMDEVLLNEARNAGARVLQPTRCDRLDTRADSVTTTLRDLTTNATQVVESTVVLLADGRGALLPNRPVPTGDFGLKAHFEHVAAPTDTIVLYGVKGHYGGVAPIEAGRWNVAFSVPKNRLKNSGKNLDVLFASIVLENKSLQEQFAGARRVTDWQTSPLSRFAVAKQWPTRIIPLGNAAAALEPVGGEGMGLAMRSAELAVETLTDGTSFDALKSSFHHLWRKRRIACRATAMLMSHPGAAHCAVEFAGAMPGLHRFILPLIGK